MGGRDTDETYDMEQVMDMFDIEPPARLEYGRLRSSTSTFGEGALLPQDSGWRPVQTPLQAKWQEGFDDGYNTGYETGVDDGRSEGYQTGIEDANEAGSDLQALGSELGTLCHEKMIAYGDSISSSGAMLCLLYPDGVPLGSFSDALLLVRIWDKMKRIATDKDAFGESPYRDIAGYGLRGALDHERKRGSE